MQASLQQLLQLVKGSEHMGCALALITASRATQYKASTQAFACALQGVPVRLGPGQGLVGTSCTGTMLFHRCTCQTLNARRCPGQLTLLDRSKAPA